MPVLIMVTAVKEISDDPTLALCLDQCICRIFFYIQASISANLHTVIHQF